MRFMIMVKATKDTEAGKFPDGIEKLFEAMQVYHDELVKAGVLLDASGLQPSSSGWKVKYAGEKRSIVDGPFTEAKEMIAGYTLIQTKTREEALEWTRRFPKPHLDHECRSRCGSFTRSRTSSRSRRPRMPSASSVSWKPD